jgi:calcium-translocating P-type ATPase
MTVVEAWICGTYYGRTDVSGKGIPTREQITPLIKELLIEGVVINSKSFIDTSKPDSTKDPVPEKWPWRDGNQTDQSLMAWLSGYNTKKVINSETAEWTLDWLDVNLERPKHLIEKNFAFDSKAKRSSIIIKRQNGGYRQYFKGASEKLLEFCDKLLIDDKGNTADLKSNKDKMEATILKMARGGLRTIAFCYVDYDDLPKDPERPDKLLDPPEPQGGTFFGLLGIHDPLRPSSRNAVNQSQRAGVIVRMVTGDHLETAKSIAMDCDILTGKHHIAMTGEEFRNMLQSGRTADLERVIPNLRVLARSKPQDKEQLVEWLKEHGEVVGVTGDGTNDAPALKKANVGIAMGKAGTRVAKTAARIVILDDEFNSVVTAIKWGRCVYDNIKKFVQFQLTINMVALAITLIGAFSDYKNPLKAIQLLWINLIMDTMAALALGTEKPTNSLLNRLPYSRDAQLISKIMIKNIVGHFLFQLMILMLLLFGHASVFPGHAWEEKSVHHYTIVFNTFVWMQVFNEFNARKVNAEMNICDGVFTNVIFLAVLVISVGLQILMVEVFGPFVETVPLPWDEWLICIGFGALSLVNGLVLRLIPVDEDWGRVGPPSDAFARDLPEWLERQGGSEEKKETSGLLHS